MVRSAMTLVCLLVAAISATADDFPKQSSPLFDGKTLDGWEGNEHYFRVQDGCIVAGRLDEKIPHNEFLCTEQEYGDFELRLEAKLVGQGNNAGVQFRSKRVEGNTEVSGYQADIGGAWNRLVWGALYDESRRNRMLAEPEPKLTQSILKEGWNELRVRAEGNHIQIFLNGEKTVDFKEQDDKIPSSGIIGLQIHSGKPTEAWYRNIRIRKL